ncbi:hypothetical protein PYCCODRAFT_924416 [Trametes coccinea BRFM310]|uniref:Uncharacterized protein n=1 Tax=Trametes coccinea (strain BRFM310) TaxID=1353009 RepID=A0A1Y2IZ71_TRAC3|nr:hypothetical protein PYCCODRAFT_924416 [Trametes coccinea BRFM310]
MNSYGAQQCMTGSMSKEHSPRWAASPDCLSEALFRRCRLICSCHCEQGWADCGWRANQRELRRHLVLKCYIPGWQSRDPCYLDNNFGCPVTTTMLSEERCPPPISRLPVHLAWRKGNVDVAPSSQRVPARQKVIRDDKGCWLAPQSFMRRPYTSRIPRKHPVGLKILQ